MPGLCGWEYYIKEYIAPENPHPESNIQYPVTNPILPNPPLLQFQD